MFPFPSLPFKTLTILTVDNGWVVVFQEKDETKDKDEDEDDEEANEEYEPAWPGLSDSCFPASSPAKFKTFVFTDKTDLCQFLKEKL